MWYFLFSSRLRSCILYLILLSAVALTTRQTQATPMEHAPSPLQSFAEQQEQLKTYGLPIVSPSLQLGKLSPRRIDIPYLSHPIAIVGCTDNDCSTCVGWLHTHRHTLEALNAVVWLVNANSLAAVNKIKAAAGRCPLIKASGELFATQYDIHYYPVLITANHIEQ